MAKLTPKRKSAPIDFENALKELEALVEHMEQGAISLEESLKCFERGVQLTRACQQALKDAEQKVNILVEKSGHTEIQPLENNSED